MLSLPLSGLWWAQVRESHAWRGKCGLSIFQHTAHLPVESHLHDAAQKKITVPVPLESVFLKEDWYTRP
ncbi:hypothetical protein I79_000123 [Cricetulus griseus]|uniref:Uncharacterized protein n=1 Tax=Cricetulus griseus TaxID=10029 RepID=G3GRH8_CRIGR|nr:hypothetical protein I79_000123 [Cricetulus griseus]